MFECLPFYLLIGVLSFAAFVAVQRQVQVGGNLYRLLELALDILAFAVLAWGVFSMTVGGGWMCAAFVYVSARFVTAFVGARGARKSQTQAVNLAACVLMLGLGAGYASAVELRDQATGQLTASKTPRSQAIAQLKTDQQTQAAALTQFGTRLDGMAAQPVRVAAGEPTTVLPTALAVGEASRQTAFEHTSRSRGRDDRSFERER